MNAARTLINILSDQPRERIHFDLSPLQPFIADSIRYLESPEAHQSIEACPYWPKWDSPWWHMAVLFEMGMADRIPGNTARRLLSEINATHYPYFFRDQPPKEKTPKQDAPCPCSFGNIYQILNAAGVDFDAELPWARGWFVKYQMPDGGLNCDEGAYRCEEANTSSLVGTIACLEAILSTPERLTPEEIAFLDRGAKCLMDRELRLGSPSKFNAEERLCEEDWLKPCFPRLYFYDVLRGLNHVVRWADVLNRPLPASSILRVVEHVCLQFPDGRVRPQRRYDDVSSKWLDESGRWRNGQPASHFSLQKQVSETDRTSPFLTGKWQDAVQAIDRLTERGLIV
jgi:hypothetical protein